MPQFDGTPYTQLTSPARGDVQGVIKDISESLPENQTKYATQEDLQQFGSWASKVRSVTASGTVTISDTDPMFVEIDPNGSDRNVNFPAKSDNNHGYFMRHSGSANTLTLKRSGGATITTLAAGDVKYIMPSTINDFSTLVVGTSSSNIPTDGWIAATSVTATGRSQAYTNDPAAGASITLNMTSTTGFAAEDYVWVSSSAGSEMAMIASVVANTSITVKRLALNHTTTNPLVTAYYFVTSSDLSASIFAGMKIKFTQTTQKYAYVESVSGTTIKLTPSTEYPMGNQSVSVSSISYSPILLPASFPSYLTYTTYYTGFSADPVQTLTYSMLGARINIAMGTTSQGTSNQNYLTMSLPVRVANNVIIPTAVTDGGTEKIGTAYAAGSTKLLTFYAGAFGTVFSTSLGKLGNCALEYVMG